MVYANLENKVEPKNEKPSRFGFLLRGIPKIGLGIFRLFSSNNERETVLLDEQEKQRFREYVRTKYNIADNRLDKLSEMIEHEYQGSGRVKSREAILEEEQRFTKEYREFQTYVNNAPANFVAKSIIEQVNLAYKQHNGIKSVARIFHDLKTQRSFQVGFSYNSSKNQYDFNVGDVSGDIRDLAILKLQKHTNYKKLNVTQDDYRKGRLSLPELYEIKRNIILGLDYYAQRFSSELEKLGFNIRYKGVDRVLEDNYKISGSGIRKSPRPHYPYASEEMAGSLYELVGV
ncbi:MAG: hypothetical protein Q8N99_05100 [Nanoarchaeota archaeon]|nr:hypothetical protein [Nanoarchaeota archaeon]